MPSQETIRGAFALFDRDGDGLLSPDELKTIMCKKVPGGVQHTEAEVDALVRRFDKDGDNKLSMEEMAEAWAELGLEPTIAAQQFGQQFDLLTPMLVMPFGVFKAQGRIMKSTKVRRDEALAKGSLVVHEESSSKVVIFVSHTWWDRTFKDDTNDPNNPYDQGAPDWQKDYPEEEREIKGNWVTYQRPKDRKWRIICAGVQRLIEQERLKEEDVSLWVDWQSIYQDDEAEKLKGVVNLIRRIEYFVFSLLAEMRGHEVQLYAIQLDGALHRYPEVTVYHKSLMPSGGALANPNDKALVTGLEDKMIEAYGTALVEVKCKAAGRSKKVDLGSKMLRPQHVVALFAAVERYRVTELNLKLNQLGAEGGALVAAALKTNTTLTSLEFEWNNLGPEGGMAIAEALKGNTTLTLEYNDLDADAKRALKAAAGSGLELVL